MKLYLRHHTANFFYCLDLVTEQVESCSTVGGRERIERYEGVSRALQTGNVLITEQEYNNAKGYVLRQVGFAPPRPVIKPLYDSSSPMRSISNLLFPPQN